MTELQAWLLVLLFSSWFLFDIYRFGRQRIDRLLLTKKILSVMQKLIKYLEPAIEEKENSYDIFAKKASGDDNGRCF